MKKAYLEITKKEIFSQSLFEGICTSLLAGSFRHGILSFFVTVIVWTILMYLINLIWFSYGRKWVKKVGEKITGKIKSLKRAGKQNAIQSGS